MVDPLSLASGAAGLLALALQTTEYLFKYYERYRDRDADVARTTDRLGGLLQNLEVLNDVVQKRQWRTDEKQIIQSFEQSLHQCQEVIQELELMVKKLKTEPSHNLKQAIKATAGKAVYPFRRSTLTKLDEEIDEFRGNISVVIQALQLKEHQNTQNDIEELKELVKTAQAQCIVSDVRHWLKAPDATEDYNIACSKRHAGTGLWFIQGPAFTKWLERDNSFLWLYGFAACGKSVLCSTIIQHAFRQQRSQSNSAIAFFFFSFQDKSKQDDTAVLRALLLQLCGQIEGMDTELSRLKDTSRDGTPHTDTLLDYLRQAITRARHVYILLDAVDECPVDDKREGVLLMIETIRQWRLPALHLLVTSRDAIDIRQALAAEAHEMVALKNNEISQDIRDYISYKVDHDDQLRRWGDHRDIIKKSLAERADGVFRWVECQLGPLRQCPKSKYDLDRCLKELPKTLDETYERMLLEINPYCQERAQQLLTLLILSARPLFVDEVIEAIALDVNELERYDTNRKLENSEDLLRVCPGLIEVYIDHDRKQWWLGKDDREAESMYEDSDQGERQHGDQDHISPLTRGTRNNMEIVRIAHFSVQEYLMSNRIKRESLAAFTISTEQGHWQVAKACLIYLYNKDFLDHTLTRTLARQYAFARYAAEFWHHHSRHAKDEEKEGILSWTKKLFSVEKIFQRWVRLCRVDDWRRSEILYHEQPCISASALYYAAYLGLQEILILLLSYPKADIHHQAGFYGTPLQAAATLGHGTILKLLLDAGADVNAQGGDHYDNALTTASRYGHTMIVQILLDAGADVNAQCGGSLYGNALTAASANGHARIVQILLEAGADVDAQCGGFHRNALMAASDNGHAAIVQILLEAGAEIDRVTQGSNATALITASKSGHVMVVQALLTAGAEVDKETQGLDPTALTAASERGHVMVVQALLTAGAEVNKETQGSYKTALIAASESGHVLVVQALLNAGAEIDKETHEVTSQTALIAASKEGHVTVVQALLNAGAEIDKEMHAVISLIAASEEGHLTVVQALLNTGVDIDKAMRGCSETALIAASSYGREAVVRLLLDAGADPNIGRGAYRTALDAAWGYETVVKLLLEHGADIDIRNRCCTALDLAASRGHESVVRLLLKTAAFVSIDKKILGRALHLARKACHDEVMTLLLESGAISDDTQASDNEHSIKRPSAETSDSKQHRQRIRMI